MRPYAANRASVTERHVQAIWYDERLRPPSLSTVRGETVAVVDPGTWNLEAGPDFRCAVLELGRERRRMEGDVEVHMRPSDWRAHGHGDDPAYGKVVMHVTWFSGKSPCDLPPGCESLCIGEHLRARGGFSPDEIDVTAYPYAMPPASDRPCFGFFADDPDFGIAVLSDAGRHRLRVKANRFRSKFARGCNPEQVFYEELFASFGYAKNVVPFRALAERLPLRDLPDTEEAAYAALSCVADMEVERIHPWKRANVRPGNSPVLRMEDAAAIFTGGKPHHLGVRLSAAIIANVIVPFAMAREVLKEAPVWLPPESQNSVTRLAAYRLFGRDHNPAMYSGNGVLLQGLIQIHRDYCIAARYGCADCGLVDSLKNEHRERKTI